MSFTLSIYVRTENSLWRMRRFEDVDFTINRCDSEGRTWVEVDNLNDPENTLNIEFHNLRTFRDATQTIDVIKECIGNRELQSWQRMLIDIMII